MSTFSGPLNRGLCDLAIRAHPLAAGKRLSKRCFQINRMSPGLRLVSWRAEKREGAGGVFGWKCVRYVFMRRMLNQESVKAATGFCRLESGMVRFRKLLAQVTRLQSVPLVTLRPKAGCAKVTRPWRGNV